MITLIAAVALDGAIGKDNSLLWKVSEDLMYYKARTLDNVVIIGRKTYESLPHAALKHRKYIVVTGGPCLDVPEDDDIDVRFSPSPQFAVRRALEEFPDDDIYIAGGQSIYHEMINDCDYAYVTWIGMMYPAADAKFPVGELLRGYDIISQSDWIEGKDDQPAYKFSTYKNKRYD